MIPPDPAILPPYTSVFSSCNDLGYKSDMPYRSLHLTKAHFKSGSGATLLKDFHAPQAAYVPR